MEKEGTLGTLGVNQELPDLQGSIGPMLGPAPPAYGEDYP